jgi:radical SAM superfamily enzyme YgiQ (UPF0313 family)
MHVLLLRPVPGNDRFGLGPFFRVEPLGLEYIASALEARGHRTTVVDLRFGRSVEHYIRRVRPELVGIACMHALETEEALTLARRVRRLSPSAFVLLGGHAASAYPSPFLTADIDALATGDGEQVVPLLADALQHRRPLSTVPGLWLRDPGSTSESGAAFERTSGDLAAFDLDDVPLPARGDMTPWRSSYACLLYRPVWLIETARGCPFRCSFCSVWPMYERDVRLRSIESVCEDFAATGPNIFVADDLFWYQPARSLELAAALRQRGIRKHWILVQSRTDLVARHPELLEAWRPVADIFDIFFGLEAATDEGLDRLTKDSTVSRTVEAIEVSRACGFGVTGNFVIDPDWDETDFERLWTFVERHSLSNAGFTVLTPLPGTAYFEEMRPRIRAESWAQFDMHHLLWEPRLGVRRFFELYCETWRRSVLNLKGRKSWRNWVRQVRPSDLPLLTLTLLRSQRMMRPSAYIAEHRLPAEQASPGPILPETSLR